MFFGILLGYLGISIQRDICLPGSSECKDNSMHVCDVEGNWIIVDCPENTRCELRNGGLTCVKERNFERKINQETDHNDIEKIFDVFDNDNKDMEAIEKGRYFDNANNGFGNLNKDILNKDEKVTMSKCDGCFLDKREVIPSITTIFSTLIMKPEKENINLRTITETFIRTIINSQNKPQTENFTEKTSKDAKTQDKEITTTVTVTNKMAPSEIKIEIVTAKKNIQKNNQIIPIPINITKTSRIPTGSSSNVSSSNISSQSMSSTSNSPSPQSISSAQTSNGEVIPGTVSLQCIKPLIPMNLPTMISSPATSNLIESDDKEVEETNFRNINFENLSNDFNMKKDHNIVNKSNVIFDTEFMKKEIEANATKNNSEKNNSNLFDSSNKNGNVKFNENNFNDHEIHAKNKSNLGESVSKNINSDLKNYFLRNESYEKSQKLLSKQDEGSSGGSSGGSSSSGGDISAQEIMESASACGFSPPQENCDAVAEAMKKESFKRDEGAMFVAQIIHESVGLTKTEEEACQGGTSCASQYDDGTGQPDKSYHGRGFMQLSWAANYKAASEGIGMGEELVMKPEMVAEDVKIGAQTSVWFWVQNVRNAPGVSDNQFGATTKAINGALECTGSNDDKSKKRYEYYLKVAEVLKIENKASEEGCYS
ncbi:endochitinase [Hamiltosporidium magnivora]|uniref:Endochitinase n=1 Tax=Hamiltosporidium magnivora TaxID=148818 RepID=A0A4Q9LG16_9MICR|nr:endochitinase [Hamiltosporidium magnivora]